MLLAHRSKLKAHLSPLTVCCLVPAANYKLPTASFIQYRMGSSAETATAVDRRRNRPDV